MDALDSEATSCKKVRGNLDSYLSAELPAEIAADVSKHLESCQDCSAALAGQAQLKKVLQRAVRQENASDALRQRILRETRATPPRAALNMRSGRWAFAAIALLVACLGIWSVISLRRVRQASDSTSYQANLARTVSEPIREMLNIGLSDHIECALENGFAKQHFTDAEMTREIGANYARLLPLVQAKAGTDYEVVVAHHCIANEREFVHLILRNGETILSFVLTEKNGESFSGGDQTATLEASGVAVYQSRLRDFAVAGFETPGHLAFVVSNLRTADNLRIAAQVAPSVRDFLAQLEVSASRRET